MAKELKLRGIITALLTPFDAEGNVDEVALEELVDFQIRSGVNGLFPLGTTGMGPAMEPDERKKVAKTVVNKAAGKAAVIVQVGDADPKVSIDLARNAEEVGADAIASLTPFYYHPGSEPIVDYFKRLAKATALPVLVYNIPRHTGNNVDAKLLLQLSQIPNVVGIKDSSRDFSQLLDYLTTLPSGFTVINGTDSYLFSAFCAGVDGGVSATANAFPELFVRMYQAYVAGDIRKGQELQKTVHALRDVLSNPPLAPLLEALRFRGLKSGSVRPPLRSLSQSEKLAVRAMLERVLPQLGISA